MFLGKEMRKASLTRSYHVKDDTKAQEMSKQVKGKETPKEKESSGHMFEGFCGCGGVKPTVFPDPGFDHMGGLV